MMRTCTALLGLLLLCACSSDGGDPDAAFQDLDQKAFVYEIMSQAYLYYDEVPALDPETFDSPEAVLASCVVGAPRDRWSYITSIDSFNSYFGEGEYLGWGFTTVLDQGGYIAVALVQPGSPADDAGMKRGDRIIAIDDINLDAPADANAYAAALGPSEEGYSATLILRDADSDRSVTIAKATVTIDPVPYHSVIDNEGSPVGYLVFHDFISTAIDPLEAAAIDFKAAGVHDVIVDLRYNRGGSLNVTAFAASLLHTDAPEPLATADAFAAEAGVEPDIFAILDYNDNGWHQDVAYVFSQLDATLDLDRIVFLTGSGTASASELLINGLAPYHDVVTVGDTTHGKPVGMNTFVHDESGMALVPLTFSLTNVLGEGAYFDGIAPDAERDDDIDHALGDAAETLLATALDYLATGSFVAQPAAAPASEQDDDLLYPLGFMRVIGKH